MFEIYKSVKKIIQTQEKINNLKLILFVCTSSLLCKCKKKDPCS